MLNFRVNLPVLREEPGVVRGNDNLSSGNDDECQKSVVLGVQYQTTIDKSIAAQHCQHLQPSEATVPDNKSARRSLRLKQKRNIKGDQEVFMLDVGNNAEQRSPQAAAETLVDNEKELEHKLAERSPRSCRQQKQMKTREESVSQNSKVDSPRRNACVNVVTSSHDGATHRSAAKTSVADEGLLEFKPTRSLSIRGRRKKTADESLNQTSKIDSLIADLVDTSVIGESLEVKHDTDRYEQSKTKPGRINLRSCEHLKKQTEKSLGSECTRKPNISNQKQGMCNVILPVQLADGTREPLTVEQTTGLEDENVNDEHGYTRRIVRDNADSHTDEQSLKKNCVTGISSSSVDSASLVHIMCSIPNEVDAASLSVQSGLAIIGDIIEGASSSCKQSPSAVGPSLSVSQSAASQSGKLLGSDPNTLCSLHKQSLSIQPLASTQATAIDYSQCSTVFSGASEDTNTALLSVFWDAATNAHQTSEVKHANGSPDGTTDPVDMSSKTSASKLRDEKTSVNFDLSANTYHTCATDMTTEPTVCSPSTEARRRTAIVIASITSATVDMDNNEQLEGENAENLDVLPVTESNIHENTSNLQISNQNSMMIASQEHASTLPSVVSVSSSQRYFGMGFSSTISSEGTRLQGISCKVSMNEHASEGEDPLADYTESQLLVSKETSQQKCSVSNEISQSVDSLRQMQKHGLNEMPEDGPELNEIPPTYFQEPCYNELKNVVKCSTRDDSAVGFSQFSQMSASQQCLVHKCSVACGVNYKYDLQDEQKLNTVEQPLFVQYTSPEVNEISNSLPLTHSVVCYQEQTTNTSNRVSPLQPFVSFSGEAVDSFKTDAVTQSESSVSCVITHGSLSDSAFHRHGLHNTDTNQSCGSFASGDGVNNTVDADGSQRRVKVSEAQHMLIFASVEHDKVEDCKRHTE